MVTSPVADETPELVPNVPDVALNLTVTPETGRLNESTTLAVMTVEFEPSGFMDAVELLRRIVSGDAAILMATCAVTLVPTTLAVMVSVRSAKLPLDETVEKGMVTTPDVEERPELTPKLPPVVLNLTVAPETGKLLASTTVAVIVAVVDPSAFIDEVELLRITEAAVVVPEVLLALPVAPPPPPHPVKPIRLVSIAPVRNTRNIVFSMAAPITPALPDSRLDLFVDDPRRNEHQQFLLGLSPGVALE